MPVSSSTEHWIKPDALTINLNHFGDPDYLQVSVLAGAVVMAFKQDVIGYNAAHNYRTWPLEAANTYLETTSAYNVYARLTRSEVNARALVVYDPILRDIEGREITYVTDEETGNEVEVLGDANSEYFFVFLGQISASVNSGGSSVQREWIADFRSGSLETNQQKNDYYGAFEKMFRPHFDDPLDPDKLTWIEALSNLGVAGGITSFINNGLFNIPQIYDGLPIDNQTLYWEETTNEDGSVTRVLKAKGGGSSSGGGGVADSVHWDNIEGKPDFSQYVTSDALDDYLPLSGGTMTGDINFDRSSYPTKGISFDGEYCKIYSDKSDHLTIRSIHGIYLATNNAYTLDYRGGGITINGGKISYNESSGYFSLDHDLKMDSKSIYFGTGYISGGQSMYIRDVRGITLSTGYEKPLIVSATGIELYGGLIEYDPSLDAFKLNGNLLVTGGITSFSTGNDSPSWMIDTETYDRITSTDTAATYTARVSTLIKGKLDEVAATSDDSATKISSIKAALSSISSSSTVSAIGSALRTIYQNL